MLVLCADFESVVDILPQELHSNIRPTEGRHTRLFQAIGHRLENISRHWSCIQRIVNVLESRLPWL
jgi:hypothetical protein